MYVESILLILTILKMYSLQGEKIVLYKIITSQ